jgi:hypothetical protein
MLSKLFRRLTYANVMSTIAVFGVLAGGTAYAANTVRSTDIVDGQVNSADVKDQSLTTFDVSTFIGADIVDGSLTAKDVGQNEFNFPASVPSLPAHSCFVTPITGIAAQGDHLLLTPDYDTTSNLLTYGVEYKGINDDAELKVCNPVNIDIPGAVTYFNLLVIQH